MSSTLSYRISREDDIPGLIRLWEHDSDWGTLTPEEWKVSYIDTPHGPSIIPVAVDAEGEIAGVMYFIPSLVAVGSDTYKAVKMSSMILRKDIRTASAPTMFSKQHPVARLYNTGIQEAIAKGYSIVYAFPLHPWHLFFRSLGNFSSAEYRCVATPVHRTAMAVRKLPDNMISRVAVNFGEEYADLWNMAQKSIPIACGVVRHPDWLRWLGGGAFTVEVREKVGGYLVGYCSVGRRRGMINDLLARKPQDVPLIVGATVRLIQSATDDEPIPPMKYLSAMETPFLQPVLHSLGFTPVEWRFAFVCTSIDPALRLERISAEKWYIMAGT
jgi:hypothetical protein